MSGLSGLASLGFFAGGAAKGYEVSQEQRRKNEEHEWRKEEQDRDKVLRESVARAQGLDVRAPVSLPDDVEGPRTTQYQVGNQAFDQRPTDEQVQGLRTQATSRAYRTAGKVAEAESLDTGVLNREHLKLSNAHQKLSNETEAATKRVTDKWTAMLEDPAKLKDYFGGQGSHQGTAYKVEPTNHGAYVSQPDVEGPPQHYTNQQIQEFGQQQMLTELAAVNPHQFLTAALGQGIKLQEIELKKKELGIHARTAAAAEKNAQTTAEYHGRGGVAERVGMAGVNARNSYVPKFSPVGTLEDGTPVSFSQDDGRYTNGLTGEMLSKEQIKLLPKISGAKAPAAGFSPAINTQAAKSYGELDMGSGKEVALFDLRYPGWRDAQGLSKGGGLNLDLGIGKDKPPAAQGLRAPGGRMTSGSHAPATGLPNNTQTQARQLYMQIQNTQPGGSLEGTDPGTVAEWQMQLNDLQGGRQQGGMSTPYSMR